MNVVNHPPMSLFSAAQSALLLATAGVLLVIGSDAYRPTPEVCYSEAPTGWIMELEEAYLLTRDRAKAESAERGGWKITPVYAQEAC